MLKIDKGASIFITHIKTFCHRSACFSQTARLPFSSNPHSRNTLASSLQCGVFSSGKQGGCCSTHTLGQIASDTCFAIFSKWPAKVGKGFRQFCK